MRADSAGRRCYGARVTATRRAVSGARTIVRSPSHGLLRPHSPARALPRARACAGGVGRHEAAGTPTLANPARGTGSVPVSLERPGRGGRLRRSASGPSGSPPASSACRTGTAAARRADSTAPVSSPTSTASSVSGSPTTPRRSTRTVTRSTAAGLRPGDLVFFHGLGHVGLYIGRRPDHPRPAVRGAGRDPEPRLAQRRRRRRPPTRPVLSRPHVTLC